MMFHDLHSHQQYYRYRAQELYSQAHRERLALEIIHDKRRMRFYYPVLAQFGRWLMTYGHRLYRRYGAVREFPAVTSRPAHRHI
jgi:hypothetical protein